MSEVNSNLADVDHQLAALSERTEDIDDAIDAIASLVAIRRARELDSRAAELARWDRSLTQRERRVRHLPAAELEQLRAARDVWRELAQGLAQKRGADG
jgi:hypothetical protein